MKDQSQNSLVTKIKKYILDQLKKDKLFEYLKKDSYLIKRLIRNPNEYKEIKKTIKEKYKLRITDKITNTVNDLELVTNIISTIN